MQDLNEQAAQGVDRVILESGTYLDRYEAQVARLAWLDGYKAGLEAVSHIAQEAILHAMPIKESA